MASILIERLRSLAAQIRVGGGAYGAGSYFNPYTGSYVYGSYR